MRDVFILKQILMGPVQVTHGSPLRMKNKIVPTIPNLGENHPPASEQSRYVSSPMFYAYRDHSVFLSTNTILSEALLQYVHRVCLASCQVHWRLNASLFLIQLAWNFCTAGEGSQDIAKVSRSHAFGENQENIFVLGLVGF